MGQPPSQTPSQTARRRSCAIRAVATSGLEAKGVRAPCAAAPWDDMHLAGLQPPVTRRCVRPGWRLHEARPCRGTLLQARKGVGRELMGIPLVRNVDRAVWVKVAWVRCHAACPSIKTISSLAFNWRARQPQGPLANAKGQHGTQIDCLAGLEMCRPGTCSRRRRGAQRQMSFQRLAMASSSCLEALRCWWPGERQLARSRQTVGRGAEGWQSIHRGLRAGGGAFAAARQPHSHRAAH